MDPIIGGALIGGAASYFGQQQANIAAAGLSGGDKRFARIEAGKSRAFNAREAIRQRKWQTHMSNTAYQRAMDDMGKAGLNPMLVAGMSGASTPSGAAASASAASAPQSHRPQDALGPAVNSAIRAAQMGTELKLAKEELKNKKKTGVLLDNQAKKVNQETESIQHDNTGKKQDAKFYEENPVYRQIQKYLNLFGFGASSAAGAAAGYGFGKAKAKGKPKGNPQNAKKYKYTSPQLKRFNTRPH
jgi:hypothetical protein